jgi:hypothetical protein
MCSRDIPTTAYGRDWWHEFAEEGHQRPPTQRPPSYEGMETRDRRVLYDDLYPGYGRTAAENYDPRLFRRYFNLPTQVSSDTYRLVGYLTNPNANIQTWKLYGKQRHRNSADFYMTPAMLGYDLKVQITNDIVTSREKLRDLDLIPSEITFASPLLDPGTYTFVELPKSELQDMRYF